MSDQWLALFLEYLIVERNYSPRTVSSYRHTIRWFSTYLSRTNQEFCQDSVSKYLYYIRTERKNGPGTVNKQIHTLRHFSKWACRKGYLTENPTEETYRLKVTHSYPAILSAEEVIRLIEAPVSYRGERQAVMYPLICKLLCCTGMRRQEIVDLDVGSFDFTNRTIRILGKGRKERIIPIPDPLIEPVLRYFNRYSSIFDVSGPAFLSNRGNRLSPYMIGRDIKLRGKVARIAKPVYPHLLRHTFASHLATQDGVSFIKISQILGHSDPKITYEYYTRILPKDLRPTMSALPWLDRLSLHTEVELKPEIAILSRGQHAFDRPTSLDAGTTPAVSTKKATYFS